MDHVCSVQRILFEWHQLDGTPALAQRFFLSTQTGIYQRQNTYRRAKIRLRPYDLLLFWTNRGKRGARLCLVFHHTGKQAAAESRGQLRLVVAEVGVAKFR